MDARKEFRVLRDGPIPGMGVAIAPSPQTGKSANGVAQGQWVARGDQDGPWIISDGLWQATDCRNDQRQAIAHRDVGGGTG